MVLEPWAAPPARHIGVAARGRDRAGGRAAAEPSATRAAAPAPVFVYKPGSACKRNKALLPGAWRPLPAREEGLSGARGWRQRQGPVRGGRSQPVRSPFHMSTPAGAPTHPQRLEVQAPPPLTSRIGSGTLSKPWEQQYPRKSASRIKGGDAHSGILSSYCSVTE